MKKDIKFKNIHTAADSESRRIFLKNSAALSALVAAGPLSGLASHLNVNQIGKYDRSYGWQVFAELVRLHLQKC